MQLKFNELYSSSVINWTIFLPWIPDYLIQQIKDDPEKYRNLWTARWWKKFMNESERNLPSHPNRSPGHIPYRITQLREAAEYEVLQYFHSKTMTFSTWNYSEQNQCQDCGMTHTEMSEADNLMTTWLKPYRENLSYQDVEEWEQAVAECLEQVKPQVHPSAFAIIQDQQLNSWTAGRGFPFGFCPSCYQKIKSRAQQSINIILDES